VVADALGLVHILQEGIAEIRAGAANGRNATRIEIEIAPFVNVFYIV
jgi:hypothetical protein